MEVRKQQWHKILLCQAWGNPVTHVENLAPDLQLLPLSIIKNSADMKIWLFHIMTATLKAILFDCNNKKSPTKIFSTYLLTNWLPLWKRTPTVRWTGRKNELLHIANQPRRKEFVCKSINVWLQRNDIILCTVHKSIKIYKRPLFFTIHFYKKNFIGQESFSASHYRLLSSK